MVQVDLTVGGALGPPCPGVLEMLAVPAVEVLAAMLALAVASATAVCSACLASCRL